jgi:hypothetical protein
MTLSILMYGLMGGALAALVAILVFDVIASRAGVSLAPRRAAPPSRLRRGRVRPDRDCPQRGARSSSPAARRASRSRERATPGSCRRSAA